MAVLDKSLDSKILLSAKNEFFKKGFEKASLREICKNANVSTGAVYTRFNSKEQLFEELVKDIFHKVDEKFKFNDNNIQCKKIENSKDVVNWILSNNELENIATFIYDNYDGFRLIINCSNDSIYRNFLHLFVDKSQNLLMNFFNKTNSVVLTVDKEELHLMLTTFWNAIFEVVKHNFSKEKAISYCKVLSNFFNWKSIIDTK